MMGTAELVLFGMQASIKLAQAGRKAYVEDTALRDIVLPLPVVLGSDLITAREHAFHIQQADPERYEREFRAIQETGNQPGDPAQQRQAQQALLQLYLQDLARGLVRDQPVNCQDVAGLTALRQWATGEVPFPSPLQRIAGALVEMALDYFVNTPAAVNEHTTSGKAIKAFLRGLEGLDFEETRLDQLLTGLFMTGLDTLTTHPDIFQRDNDEQHMITIIVEGLAKDMHAQLQKLPAAGTLTGEENLARFGQLLLRSLLRNTGTTVLNNPTVLGIQPAEGERALLQRVGTAWLDLLLADTGPAEAFSLAEALRRTASTEGLDRLILTAIKAASEYPEVFRLENTAFETWLKHVLTDLYTGHANGEPFFDTDLFPEVAFLVMENGLRNLPILLMDGMEQEQRLLLTQIARQLFEALAEHQPNGRMAWKFALARGEVLTLFQSVLSAVAMHPAALGKTDSQRTIIMPLVQLVAVVLPQLETVSLKELLQSDMLTTVLPAILASGILPALGQHDADLILQTLNKVVRAIESDGVTGLERLLQPGTLTDLLAVLADSQLIEPLLGADTAETMAIIIALVQVSRQLRAGEMLARPEIRKQLTAA